MKYLGNTILRCPCYTYYNIEYMEQQLIMYNYMQVTLSQTLFLTLTI